MELTFALDSAVKGLRDKGSPVLRRDMLMTASLQSSHFKCPLKKEKKNKQTNKQYQLFRRSLRRRRRFDLQSWTKWMGDLSPLPPAHSPLNQGLEMARFGFCAASSLTWEGGWGLLFHFIMSKIAIF